MDRFSIDDVRESFAVDMAAKIRRVREAGEALLAAEGLQAPVGIDPVDGVPGFDAVSQACHAIFGTSALVEARSLAESARLLEILSVVGRNALAEIDRSARLGRSLGEACVEGADALGRMLDLELDHRGREAWELALEFRARMARWEESRDLIAEGAPPEEFAFDVEAKLPGEPANDREPSAPLAVAAAGAVAPSEEDVEFSFGEDEAGAAPGAGAATATPGDEHLEFSFGDEEPRLEAEPRGAADVLASELVEVFRQEAREGLPALGQALRQLAEDPRDRDALVVLERIFHTLKGSAATVGLARVSAMAVDLQDSAQDALQRALDRGAGFPREALVDLVTRTNSLLGAAELPLVDPFVAEPRALVETERAVAIEGPAYESARTEARALGPGLREPVALSLPPEVLDAFEEETAELLAAIEAGVLMLEESPQPQAVLLDLFRSYHTLKGSLNTVGLAPLGRVVHRIEDFIEELAQAAILPPLRHLATLLLDVQDDIRRGLARSREGFVETRLPEIEAEIVALRAGGPGSETRGLGSARSSSSSSASASARSAASTGRSVATTGGSSADLEGPSSRSPRRRFTDRAPVEDRRTVRVTSERLDGLMDLTGELVVGRSRLLRRVARVRALQRMLALGHQRLVGTVDRFREQHEFSVGVTRSAAPSSAGGTAWGGFGALEFDQYGEVNILARQVGTIADEVASVQAQIQEVVSQLADDAASFGVIVSGLQNEITRARMVPVDDLFARLRLPARDAAQREGKSVRVTTSGEDVALDKTIVDQLYAPLLHVVRNAVSHGIEPAARRQAAGKDPVGTVSLAARQESGLIVLEVGDDGAGLDLVALRDAAVRMGLLPHDASPDDPAVAEALFQPGLSTRASADAIAGRGMGGDVVRRGIEKLGGDIRVRTAPGQGTRFTITLPLTLAITRALLLRNGAHILAVPLSFAERLVDLAEAQVIESAGARRLRLADGYVPLLSLDAALQQPDRGQPPAAAVLLRAGDRRLAVTVDRVLGQEEIVVKSLGALLAGHPLLSGVTLSGDGELILILDVPGLVAGRVGGERAAPVPVSSRSSGPPRVLFADDSLSVRKVAEKLFIELGAEVTLAVDGQDAMEILARQPFDIVFTDLEMPRLHGFEVIQAIGAQAALSHLPVVVVSSRSGQKHKDEAFALGARDYITKPFDRRVLGEALRRYAPGARR